MRIRLRVAAWHPTGSTHIRVGGVPSALGREWQEFAAGALEEQDWRLPWIEAEEVADAPAVKAAEAAAAKPAPAKDKARKGRAR